MAGNRHSWEADAESATAQAVRERGRRMMKEKQAQGVNIRFAGICAWSSIHSGRLSFNVVHHQFLTDEDRLVLGIGNRGFVFFMPTIKHRINLRILQQV